MRIDRYKDFITEDERLEIVKWFDDSINTGKNLFDGLHESKWGYNLRKTSRNTEKCTYPEVIFKIYERIINSFSFTQSCHKELLINKHGVIAVATLPGGDTYLHKDTANCAYNNSVIRFNILIQKPESGGVLSVYDNGTEVKVDVDESELYCCNLSDYEHSVSESTGTPRYILLFSLCCPKDDWENGIIKYKGIK